MSEVAGNVVAPVASSGGGVIAELLDPYRFTRALRAAARRQAQTREGYALVLFVPRERHGVAAVAAALVVGAAQAQAVGMIDESVFGVVLVPGTMHDVNCLVARVEALVAAAVFDGGVEPVHVVSAAKPSGARKIPAWRMRRETIECLAMAYTMAKDMGPDAFTGPSFAC